MLQGVPRRTWSWSSGELLRDFGGARRGRSRGTASRPHPWRGPTGRSADMGLLARVGPRSSHPAHGASAASATTLRRCSNFSTPGSPTDEGTPERIGAREEIADFFPARALHPRVRNDAAPPAGACEGMEWLFPRGDEPARPCGAAPRASQRRSGGTPAWIRTLGPPPLSGGPSIQLTRSSCGRRRITGGCAFVEPRSFTKAPARRRASRYPQTLREVNRYWSSFPYRFRSRLVLYSFPSSSASWWSAQLVGGTRCVPVLMITFVRACSPGEEGMLPCRRRERLLPCESP